MIREFAFGLSNRHHFMDSTNISKWMNVAKDTFHSLWEYDEDVKELFIRVGKEYYNEPYIDKHEHLNNFIDWFDFGILGKDGCEPFKFNIDTSKTTI